MNLDTRLSETVYRLDGPLRQAVGEAGELLRKTRICRGSSVLDVGAGTGYLAIPLARIVGDEGCVCCVDASSELLDVLREKAIRQRLLDAITTSVGPAESLDYPDGSFDFVFSSYTIHELNDPAAALREMWRVLKPFGQIALADYRRLEDADRCREIEGWYARQADQKGSEEVHLKFSLADMERLLLSTGFKEIQLSTWLEFHLHAVATKA